MTSLVQSITEGVSAIFGNHIWLATIIISMIPLAELKVAIPFAQARGYNFISSLACSLVGSLIVVLILAGLFIPILNALKKTKMFSRFAFAVENKVKSKSNKINGNVEKNTEGENENKISRKKYWLKFLAVVGFVAVPIPLTGVWTGTCIAVFIGLNYFSTLASVLLGNLIAGTLVFLLTKFFGEEVVFIAMLVLIAILILYMLLSFISKKIKAKNKEKNKG